MNVGNNTSISETAVCVMKQCKPGVARKQRNLFLREIISFSNLNQDNVQTIVAAICHPLTAICHRHWFSISDGKGGQCIFETLSELLQDTEHYKELHERVDASMSVALDVANGLTYLHCKNIVHRDLRPKNILLSKVPKEAKCTLQAKISNFGEAERYHKYLNSSLSSKTDCGTQALPFQAPEIVCSTEISFHPVQVRRADVWSFGCVLFCLLNPDNEYPYDVEFEASHIPRVRQFLEEQMPLKQLPKCSENSLDLPELRDVMNICLNFEPVWRPEMALIAR